MSEDWDYLISNEKFEELIRNYCTDFTQLEREGRYGPITGREKEIKDAMLILLQKGRKNVAFLAPAGVGKTAAVVGLAQAVVAGDVPEYLQNARVLEVDLARMASGTTTRAEFQDRFLPLCKAISERYHNPNEPRYILFIDEFHQLMPNCVGSSYAGLADTMKPYLTAGDLLVIAATTLDEFRMYVEQDPAMDRRFQKVHLKIPNIEETYAIMKALRPGLEKHHKVTVSDENLMLVVHLTEEHMRKRNQPDKSIITADSAMAYHVMNHGINQDVTRDSIYYMVARETGLNARAMEDEKQLKKVKDEVDILEGRVERKVKDTLENQPYDPSLKVKDVKIDKKFQSQLASEKEEDEARKSKYLQKSVHKNTGANEIKQEGMSEEEREKILEELAKRMGVENKEESSDQKSSNTNIHFSEVQQRGE